MLTCSMFLFHRNFILFYRYDIFSNLFEGTNGFCKRALLFSELCLFSLTTVVFLFHVTCFPHVFDPPWRIRISNEGVCFLLCSVGRFVSSVVLSLPGGLPEDVYNGRACWKTSFVVSGHGPSRQLRAIQMSEWETSSEGWKLSKEVMAFPGLFIIFRERSWRQWPGCWWLCQGQGESRAAQQWPS